MEEKIKQKNPSLHRYLFTITTFSKLLAMLLFIALPFIGFYLGMKYQQKITVTIPVVPGVQKTAKIIPSPLPTPTPTIIPIDITNWESYTNEKFKIKFKYPPNWKIREGVSVHVTNNLYDIAVRNESKCTDGGGGCPSFSVEVYSKITREQKILNSDSHYYIDKNNYVYAILRSRAIAADKEILTLIDKINETLVIF